MPTFTRSTRIPVSAEELFDWHERPGAFQRLTPPWERVDVLEESGGIRDGGRVVLRMRAGPFPVTWVARHDQYQKGEQFRDSQESGPFREWVHTHRTRAVGPNESLLEDSIEYRLPAGPIGEMLAGASIRKKLERNFDYRHRVTASDLEAHAGTERLRIAVTGASGLVGSRLSPFLSSGGHEVTPIQRSSTSTGTEFDPTGLDGQDAVIHLAGENIAQGRWTRAKMQRIRRSRVEGTARLAEKLAALPHPPRVLVSASAIGYYGDRGEDLLDESSQPGEGFLPEVCAEWEAATRPAEEAGIRVVHLRFGIVLSPAGGALQKMLTPFRLGLGGPIGSGRQWMSWISIEDAVGAIHHALFADSLRGPVNAVSPEPIRNREFGKTLGRALSRPALAPFPTIAARVVFGKMADGLLLSSARVAPGRLQASGYRFRAPDLETALRELLGKF